MASYTLAGGGSRCTILKLWTDGKFPNFQSEKAENLPSVPSSDPNPEGTRAAIPARADSAAKIKMFVSAVDLFYTRRLYNEKTSSQSCAAGSQRGRGTIQHSYICFSYPSQTTPTPPN